MLSTLKSDWALATDILYYLRIDFGIKITMAVVTKVGKTNEVESAKIMLNDCWLGGSEAVKSDVALFMEATKQYISSRE